MRFVARHVIHAARIAHPLQAKSVTILPPVWLRGIPKK